MNKIVIEVVFPSNGSKYDFEIPSTMKVGIAATLIGTAIADYEGMDYVDISELRLFSIDEQGVVDNNNTFRSAGICDGNRLILV